MWDSETVRLWWVVLSAQVAAGFLGWAFMVSLRIYGVWSMTRRENSGPLRRCKCGHGERNPRRMLSHLVAMHPDWDLIRKNEVMIQYHPAALRSAPMDPPRGIQVPINPAFKQTFLECICSEVLPKSEMAEHLKDRHPGIAPEVVKGIMEGKDAEGFGSAGEGMRR